MTMHLKTKTMARLAPDALYPATVFTGVMAALMIFFLSVTVANSAEKVTLDTTSGGNVTYSELDSNIEVVSGSSGVLKLEASKGQLVRLESPAATVFVADPEIANIQVKSPSLILIPKKFDSLMTC